MKQDSAYSHIIKYTGLFASVQFFTILINIVRNKVAAMLLGPQGIGLISIYNSTSVFIQNSTNFGLQTSGVREISQACDSNNNTNIQKYIQLLRSWVLLSAFLGFFTCLLFSEIISNWAFSDTEHTKYFLMLSVAVALAILSGGETAVLKGTRRLKNLATISTISIVAALFISVPLYVFFKYEGILPSIILIAFVQLLATIAYSYRYYPPSFSFKWEFLKQGKSLVSIGMVFVLAGILGSGAEFFVRSFLSDISVSLAGLYNAGYMITMTYAGMAFAALESDYFPHLSGVCHDTKKMNGAVNRQIEILVIFLSPMLVCLMIGLKIIIPLLFSSQFLPVIGMAQIALLAMYFRALNLPVSYITLAKGDSVSYMSLEAVYDVLIVATIIIGYNNWGLEGTGIALVVTNIIDVLCVTSYCMWKYDFELSSTIFKRFVLYFLLGLCTLASVILFDQWIYWIVGILLVCLNALLSYYSFNHKCYD